MTVNIAETFVETSLRNAGKTAVTEASTNRSVTFAELNARADGFAAYLSNNGLVPGKIVMLMVLPSIDFISITLALFKLGTPIVMIDPGMGYRNLLRCIEKVSPDYLIGVPKALLFARLFGSSFKSVKKKFCVGNSFGLLGPDITAKIDGTAAPYPVYHPGPDDLAAIIFTTGSTGPPKGVRYEHKIFSAQLELIRQYYKLGDQDTDQPGFPLFALFSAALGARSVIPDMDPTRPAQVDPEKFVASILQHSVTYSFGSPAIWNVVSNYCIARRIVLENVTKVLMAGAPVPYELLQRVLSILPDHAQVYTPYGATESLPTVSIESREIITETALASRKGKGTCVGRPLPGIRLKIIEPCPGEIGRIDDAKELGAFEIGEIVVKGKVVTRAYMNNDEETRLAKIADVDGFWHRMGDVGYLDGSQRLWFCGRKAHRVETGDGIYYSVCCEALINEHPEVYRSALVGLTSPGGDTFPALIVEPVKDKAIDNTTLLREVEALAKQNTLTERVEHFFVHPSFPVDIRHNAKIFREKLAIWAQKKL
ncbi:fatty acid CoA ligase family protein [Desulforhopalus singaporensis]|uniref:Acyl-CoA synthetase (AMP-forming)/AMP-acid ligase II n=1 Tax=Desulforhopalus singaporensis TaxID=91360 RepID=A0A1H0PEX8_9BACT|nr:fatty acid CoA ligase family protein [Desulforhopalus singaporensis]SDP03564.1 Acyl-CoA synthetase (AMP-forming)/AMP-acid ligase II [Desulforhopalus singaporensis]